jgi:hypothetical protein
MPAGITGSLFSDGLAKVKEKRAALPSLVMTCYVLILPDGQIQE